MRKLWNRIRKAFAIHIVSNWPSELEPVLAKIEHINSLGKSSWLNENKIDEIIELIDGKISTDKFIDNLKSNKYHNVTLNINKLNLEERLILADKFNTEIRKDCLNTIRDGYLDVELTEIERHNWLNCLSVIPTELLTISYNENEYKIYI